MLHELLLAPIFEGMLDDFVSDVFRFVWIYIGPFLCAVIACKIVWFFLNTFLIGLFESSGCGKREARKKAGLICKFLDLADNLKSVFKK